MKKVILTAKKTEKGFIPVLQEREIEHDIQRPRELRTVAILKERPATEKEVFLFQCGYGRMVSI